MTEGPLRCPCAGRHLEVAWSYDAPPEGETRFPLAGPYARTVRRCAVCDHFVSEHALEVDLYGGGYVEATYGTELRASYDRIMALPDERSDNAGRVARVRAFAGAGERSVLDVGSGLCVFLARLNGPGWHCTALDPDPRAAEHARTVVGVDAIAGDFLTSDEVGRYDVVTLNKVIEHVPDPVAMLERARDALADGGFVYVEVPDGPAAAAEGPGREEFFVEHLHVFSPASLALAAQRAGLSPVHGVRLREPSTKLTLATFLVRAP